MTAHEFTEVNAPGPISAGHMFSIENVANTTLGITETARQILRELAKS